MTKRIVVYDRERPEAAGSIIEAGAQLTKSESLGELATLPFEPSLLEHGAIAGYMRREFGVPGERFADMTPRRACALQLYVTPDFTRIHFAVRVRFDASSRPRQIPFGTFRLATAPTPSCPMTGGLGTHDVIPVELDGLTPAPDVREDAWILRGRAGVSVRASGYIALCLQGAAQGVAVTWAAVTQSSADA